MLRVTMARECRYAQGIDELNRAIDTFLSSLILDEVITY